MEREGRKLLALGAIATLSLVLALAHSGPGEHGMSGEEMGATISICLAVVEGGAALLLLALGSAGLARRWRALFAPAGPPRSALLPRSTGPCRPRAGPDLLQVFLS
ncbi:MAG: hypothetical protein ACRDK5_09415 [Solirubrobacterales bacterium]